MPECYFPLRWESTGDQWWYASPIDWAAANGHYDLVRELLHLDTNLLIRLTSLRRIRRLETVWDDDARFADAAKCRSFVARSLLHECEMKNKNSLIRAGYGGWLLYTAASAGDMNFVRELLNREPLLVFGEGEYGVTDIFYAAARSKSSEVFRLLFDFAVSPRCSVGGGDGGELVKGSAGGVSAFRWEMLNRAVHSAARGGHLEFLKELLEDCSDVLAYRDMQGSTILHTASGRGQVEVVKDLLLSFDVIDSRDNEGNTALHVASFRGHLSIVKALLMACPSSSSLINIAGDTFLHVAVAGFRTPGFRRLDRQMELMKQLISGNIVNIQGIINIRNNNGRTALHLAVVENVHTDLVELLMIAPSIDLNVQDIDGMTPLDILRQQPRSASSELLIKQLGSANSLDYRVRSAIASNLKTQGIVGNSPGTSFRISDAEIFLYTGIIETAESSGKLSSCSSASKSETTHLSVTDENHGFSARKEKISVSSAAKCLRILLRWPHRKEKITDTPVKYKGCDSFDSVNKLFNQEDTPTPLRQQFFKATSLAKNKRTLSVQSTIPSPATKKKFTAGLMHGVFQAMPHLASSACTPPSLFPTSPTAVDKEKGSLSENDSDGASSSSSVINYSAVDNTTQRASIINTRLMNQYFCFGAQDLVVDDQAVDNTNTIKHPSAR